MKKIILCVVLLLSCSCRHGDDKPRAACDQGRMSRLMEAYLEQGEPYTQGRLRTTYGFEFRGPLTIEQLEQDMLDAEKERTGGDAPLASSDFINLINDRWLHRRRHSYRPGDVFYFFRTDQSTWDTLVGSEGYLLLRKGEIIDVLVTTCQ